MRFVTFVVHFWLVLLFKVTVTSQQFFPQGDFYFPVDQSRFGGFQQPQNSIAPQTRANPYAHNIFLQFNNFLNQPNQGNFQNVNQAHPITRTTSQPIVNTPTTTPKPFVPRKPAIPPPQPILQNNRLGERISRKKCLEYANLAHKKLQFSSLSLGSSTQDLSLSQCDLTSGLIVGGKRANEKEFPHMAAIGYRDSNNNKKIIFGCGGSLISERFVLTAAHCENRDGVAASVVRLGVLELSSPNPEDFTITNFIEHEDYNVYTKQNDIAVAKLNHDACDSAKFPLTIRPACLWQTEHVWQNKAIASGWGFTGYASSASNELMKVKLDILDSSLCDKVYGDEGFTMDQKQICAGVLVGGQDTCNGDSGGPLQVVLPGSKCLSHIIGIISYGSFCGASSQPSVNTRVWSYLDWIEAKVWG